MPDLHNLPTLEITLGQTIALDRLKAVHRIERFGQEAEGYIERARYI